MSYEFPDDEDLSLEEKKLEVLNHLTNDCSLYDVIRKDRPQSSINLVSGEHPGFCSKGSSIYFDFPEEETLNGLINDGLTTVEIVQRDDSELYNYRYFLLTEKGRKYFDKHKRVT